MKDTSIRSQIIVNVGFTVIKAMSLVFSIWLADFFLSASTMGMVLLFRRQGALWGNLFQLGFSKSLQKFYTSCDEDIIRYELWGTLIRWVVVASVVALLFSVVLSEQISTCFFGSVNIFPTWSFGLYVGGLSLGFMASSSWGAEFRFVHANIIDWFNGSFIFIFSVLLFSQISDASIVVMLAILTMFASICSLLLFSYKYIPSVSFFKWNLRLERKIISFGATRSISSFLDMGMLVIGPWLLRSTPQQAGYLLISYNVLRLVSAIVMPVAQVLALRSNSYRHNRSEEVWNVLKLVILSMVGASIMVGAYYLYGDLALSLWLPNSAREVAIILDKLILFVPAFCLFYVLRNYIELAYLFPWNMLVLSLAVIGFMVGYYCSQVQGIDAVIIGTQCMLSVLFCSSLGFIIAILKQLRHEK